MLTHQKTVLANGLTVIQVPMPSVKSLTVIALANTGSRYEQPSQYGIAHFFEHMVFKGTEQYPDTQTLSSAIDAVGADFNAFTSKEYTGYYVKAASKHLRLAVDVVSDMLLTPQLRQEDIDREKGVIIEELNMYLDNPARHIGNLFEQMMYQGTGLAHDIIGTKETIKSIASDDFRSFLNKWYQLGNMVLVIAGDDEVVGTASTLQLVEKMFAKGEAARQKKVSKVNTAELVTEKMGTEQKLHLEFKQTEQAHLVMGWPGLDRKSEQRYTASLLATILGGNMSSRLFTEVREKRGLCYYVHSDIDSYHETGFFGASAGVDQTRVEEAIKVIRAEFEEAATAGAKAITQQELQKAKDYVAGKMVLGLEDSESVAQFFGMKELLLDEVISPTQVLERYQKVTLQEVQNLLQSFVQPGELRLAVIGPYKNNEDFAQLIK